MHLPWKYTVIFGIILIHVFILAIFFAPDLLAHFRKDAPSPQQIQPSSTDEPPVEQPPSTPVLEDPVEPPKNVAANTTTTPPKTPAESPSATPPKNVAANTTTTPPKTPAGGPSATPPSAASHGAAPMSKLKPYRQGHYHQALQTLPKNLATAVGEVRSGILIDLDTHAILWEKDSSKVYPIASLTKMLTSLMLLQRVESTPGLSLDGTTIKITKDDRAYFKNNKISGVYLDEGESFTLQEYLKCMIISSANDAAYIVGKYLGDGKIETGIQRMNEQAKKLGLNDMSFHNSNGLPIDRSKDQRIENTGSALSIAYLAECVMASPEYMRWAGTARDSIMHRNKPFDLNSTNHLLRNRVPGVTGLKTGYTNTAGYCIAVSCTREKRTMLLVVMGVRNRDRRDTIARQLLDWAFQQPAK
ncbi:MAG: serine hydrolase [Victivallales bacterium]|nr:serine hydrolase [Victivallales bacterium]